MTAAERWARMSSRVEKYNKLSRSDRERKGGEYLDSHGYFYQMLLPCLTKSLCSNVGSNTSAHLFVRAGLTGTLKPRGLIVNEF